jgi:hypothetical protein
MQVIETLDIENSPADIAEVLPERDRGIEFEIQSLPYCIQGSALSELKSGDIHLVNGIFKVDGRNTVPNYLRAKLYALGSLMFLPGLALAYLLIEQVSWIPASFELTDKDILAYTAKDDYHIVSILFNPSGSDMRGARRTLTFQLPHNQYLRVAHELALHFPGKKTNDRLVPAVAAGASTAALGITFWIILLLGAFIWRPL